MTRALDDRHLTGGDELVEALRNANDTLDLQAAERITAQSSLIAELRGIADRAIAAVADAEREADWNIPTFGPTTSERLAEELAALSNADGGQR